MTLLAVVWDVNPIALQIGSLQIAYYGLLWVAAFILGAFLLKKIVVKEGLNPAMVDSAFIYVLIATVVGARLGHCLFYEPSYFLSNPWQILNIRGGGLASHGAAIGMVFGILLYAKKWKIPPMWLFDRIGIMIAVGGALIRIGNLINSEIYGDPTSQPWGFIFVNRGETIAKHPTQIYEALAYIVIFFVLMHMYWRTKWINRRGMMFGVFLTLLFGMRLLIESIKEVQEPWEAALPLNMGQMLSIPFILVGIFFVFRSWNRPAQPYLNMPLPSKKPKKK